ncbi:hypothetical protein ACFL5V_11685 [Fibrobacterota bacterium]
MKLNRWVIPLTLLTVQLHAGFFNLGYDFLQSSIDGRFVFSEMTYAGFKFDPGIHTLGGGDDVYFHLDLFGRFNFIRPTEGFGLGPEAALQLIRGNELDRMMVFINFSADLVFNLTGPVYLYGHIPLIGLQINAYNNGNRDNNNIGLNSFASGFPTELGFLLEF